MYDGGNNNQIFVIDLTPYNIIATKITIFLLSPSAICNGGRIDIEVENYQVLANPTISQFELLCTNRY